MPKYYDKTVNLSKNLKNADYIGIELPQHSHRYNITKFHRLRGNNVDYLVAENEKSNKYFHKVADPAVSGPKPEEQSLPQNIINHPAQDFNPEAGNITLSGYISKDVQKPQNSFKKRFGNFNKRRILQVIIILSFILVAAGALAPAFQFLLR